MKPFTVIGALLCAALAVTAQEKAKEMKPQKEHEALKQFEGRWDVKCKWMMPGHETQENTGTETSKLTYGGFWLMCDFKGEFDKKPFEGHSMTGYDPQLKKYVTVWIGSHNPGLMTMEGEADSSGQKFTFKGECTDPQTGKKATNRVEWELTDKDHRTERIYKIGDDGKETLVGEFIYTRRGHREAK